MSIIGFNFTKIASERTGNATGKVSINNNISLTNVKEISINLGAQNSKGLLITFSYSCMFEPQVGKIAINGEIIVMEDLAVVKAAAESWQKNKTLESSLSQAVLSQVLSKSTVEAIILSRELGLPAPVPLPKIGGKPVTADAENSLTADKSAKPAKK